MNKPIDAADALLCREKTSPRSTDGVALMCGMKRACLSGTHSNTNKRRAIGGNGIKLADASGNMYHRIGTGATARVYCRADTPHVAMKVWCTAPDNNSATWNEHDWEENEELQILRYLRDLPDAETKLPGVVRVDDVRRLSNGTPMCMMARVGVDLWAHVNAQPLATGETDALCRNLVRTMMHLHGTGIVHGDLKPQNLLYTPGTQQLTLIDFSSSWRVNVHGHNSNDRGVFQTATGTSHTWAAPELWLGRRPSSEGKLYNLDATQSSDVWGLACVMFFILSRGTKHCWQVDARDLTGLLDSAALLFHGCLGVRPGDVVEFPLLTMDPSGHRFVQPRERTDIEMPCPDAAADLAGFIHLALQRHADRIVAQSSMCMIATSAPGAHRSMTAHPDARAAATDARCESSTGGVPLMRHDGDIRPCAAQSEQRHERATTASRLNPERVADVA